MNIPIKTSVAVHTLRGRTFTEPATLVRQGSGEFNEYGEFVAGSSERISVFLATAPLTGQDRELLPEGVRSKNVRKFWLMEKVNPVAEERTTGDLLEHDGLVYRAVMVQDWHGFFEVTAVEKD